MTNLLDPTIKPPVESEVITVKPAPLGFAGPNRLPDQGSGQLGWLQNIESNLDAVTTAIGATNTALAGVDSSIDAVYNVVKGTDVDSVFKRSGGNSLVKVAEDILASMSAAAITNIEADAEEIRAILRGTASGSSVFKSGTMDLINSQMYGATHTAAWLFQIDSKLAHGGLSAANHIANVDARLNYAGKNQAQWAAEARNALYNTTGAIAGAGDWLSLLSSYMFFGNQTNAQWQYYTSIWCRETMNAVLGVAPSRFTNLVPAIGSPGGGYSTAIAPMNTSGSQYRLFRITMVRNYLTGPQMSDITISVWVGGIQIADFWPIGLPGSYADFGGALFGGILVVQVNASRVPSGTTAQNPFTPTLSIGYTQIV